MRQTLAGLADRRLRARHRARGEKMSYRMLLHPRAADALRWALTPWHRRVRQDPWRALVMDPWWVARNRASDLYWWLRDYRHRH